MTKLAKRGNDGHSTSATHHHTQTPPKQPMVGRTQTIGPSQGAALAQLQQQQHLQTSYISAPNTPNSQGITANSAAGSAVAQAGDEIKPRSLRFTWSMKTTSNLAPDEMMK